MTNELGPGWQFSYPDRMGYHIRTSKTPGLITVAQQESEVMQSTQAKEEDDHEEDHQQLRQPNRRHAAVWWNHDPSRCKFIR